MADFNPLQSFLGGQAAGQQQVDRQTQLVRDAEKDKYDQMKRFNDLSEDRKKAYFDDMVIGKSLLENNDLTGFGSLIENRQKELKRLGSNDTTGTEMIIDLFNNRDIQGISSILDTGINAGRQLGYIKEDNYNSKFAPQTTAPKVDTSTGQIYYTVFDPNTKEATRVDVPNAFAQTPDEVQSGVVSVDTRKQLAKQAIDASTKAFEQLPLIKKSISNIGEAIAAVKSGAGTGPVEQFFPSITQASVTLDNLAGQMGLDVINSATFGALSEKELKFAIDTAIPRGLEGDDLTGWLERKRESQQKLARELQKMAVFLGKGGNTVADYLSQEEVNYSQLQGKSGLDTGGSQSSPQPSSGFKILSVN